MRLLRGAWIGVGVATVVILLAGVTVIVSDAWGAGTTGRVLADTEMARIHGDTPDFGSNQ